MLLDDEVGFPTSDANGRFEIRFGREAFRDAAEQRPDEDTNVMPENAAMLRLNEEAGFRIFRLNLRKDL